MKLPSKKVIIVGIILLTGMFAGFSGIAVKGTSLVSTEVSVSPVFQRQLESSLADINNIISNDIEGINSEYHVMATGVTSCVQHCPTGPPTCYPCSGDSGGGDNGGGNGGGGNGNNGPSPQERAAQEAIAEAEVERDKALAALEEAKENGDEEAFQELLERVEQAEAKLQEEKNKLEELRALMTANDEQQRDAQVATVDEGNKDKTPREGDPVMIATGAFTTSETDVSYKFGENSIAIERTYKSDNGGSHSFGPNWLFIYDTRVITGVKPNAVAEAELAEAKYREAQKLYEESLAEYNAVIKELEDILELANHAQAKIDVFYAKAQNAKTKAYKTSKQSLKNKADNLCNQAVNYRDQIENLIQKLTDAKGEVEATYTFVEQLKQVAQEFKGLAEQARREADHALSNRSKNIYVVNPTDPWHLENTGNNTLTLIDTEGVPHLYIIDAEPDYETTVRYPNGEKNYYPQGSTFTPTLPTDDKLELLSDGSYRLTKKNNTQYLYSFYGQLTQIIDANGNKIDFVYSPQHELVKIVDDFNREIILERSNGKIIKITDPKGREFTYTYNSQGLLASRTDAEGDTVRYGYHGNLLTEIIKPDGSKRQYYYKDLNGRMVVEKTVDEEGYIEIFNYYPEQGYSEYTNAAGITKRHYYNEQYLTTRIEYHDGSYVEMDYDENNNLVRYRDELGAVYHYRYDQNRNLIQAFDPAGNIEHWTYNDLNKVIAHTNKMGYTTTFDYDQKGNLLAVYYPDGSRMAFSYNNRGQVVEVTDQLGNKVNYTYDEFGNVASRTDGEGHTVYFKNDPLGNVLAYTDQAGNTTTYEYNGDNQLVKVTDPMGFTEDYHYNNRKDLVGIVDKNGNLTKLEYDKRHKLIKEENPLGEITEYQYSPDGKVIEKRINGLSHITYTYDHRGNLSSQTQVETGVTVTYKYDPKGQLIEQIDPNGNKTEYGYNALGSLVWVKDPAGNVRTYEYNNNQKPIIITDERNNKTFLTYDEMDRLIEVKDAAYNRLSYNYDAKGNLIAVIDKNGNVTTFEYDANGRMVKAIDPLGNVESWGFDPRGLLASKTDRMGNWTQYEYDPLGRLMKTVNPLGGTRHYAYDPIGNLITEINESGVATTYEYDALNRVAAVNDALGNKTLYEYNELGLLAKTTDALGNVTTYEYDEMGRLVKEIDPIGMVRVFAYDQNSNLIKAIDQEGYATTYRYDALNRLIEEENALQQKVGYAYDPKGNLVQFTDAKGALCRYEYDELDRLTKEINQLGHVQSYTYDPNGNLIVKINFNGNQTSYNFDPLNRLVEVTYADGKKDKFTYNANGEMTAAVNDNATQRYYYDQLSRLVKAEIESELDRYTVEYEYNKLGQRTKVILNDGNILQSRVTKYHYDEVMRLSRVELPDGDVVKYEYDALNRVVRQINSNRTGTNYTYTPDGKVETIEHYEGLDGYGRLIQSYGYIYNARGQRIMEVEGNGQVTAYQYDPVGRLTKVYYPFFGGKKEINRIERAHYFGLEANLDNHQDYYRQKHNPDEYIANLVYTYRNKLEDLHWQIRESSRPLDLYNNGYYIEEYRYDPVGNVILEGNAWGTIEFAYNAANQLLKAGARIFSYDANGNLVREGYGGDYVEYSYDHANRLISASNLSQNDKLFGGEHPFTGTITYTYDALGRKIGKTLTPANVNRVMVNGYYYDGLDTDILAEYEDEIWDLHQYQKGKKHTVGQIPGGQVKYFNEYYYGLGLIAFTNMNHPNPWYMQREINFYHKDALGSIVNITDRYGNVVERYRYDAYGNPYEGRFLHMPKHNPYGFTGQRFEPELRMYSFAYRMYNPMSMRWLTVDPIKDGLNWYQYCWSDPVNWVDLLGLSTSTSEYKHPDYYLPPDSSPRAEDPLLAAKGRLQQKIREASIYQRGAGGNFNRRPPEGSKIKYTWCNQATYDYTAATSPVLFNAMTGGTDRRKASDSSYNINANAAGKKLKAAEEAGIIVEIDGATAQALANRGYTVVAVQENPNGSGHLNTIAMDLHPYDSSRGPLTSDVGGKPGDLRYADTAFLSNGEAVKYYYDPNQDLNFIEESQVLNKWNYPVREEINVKDVINEPQVPNTGGDEDEKEDKKENN